MENGTVFIVIIVIIIVILLPVGIVLSGNDGSFSPEKSCL